MIKKATKPLFTGSDWNLSDIENMWEVIDRIGKEELKLSYADPSIEIVTYEQMIDAYSFTGMPVMYNHWSFGKQQIEVSKAYASKQQGLAYEMVINTDPMVTHIMENNSATMQALVLAHAVVGHGSFFKNNYLFKMWTNPKAILPYLQYAKDYIAMCEREYGYEKVTKLLDACHSLSGYGVDRYRKREKRKKKEHQERVNSWKEYSGDYFKDLDITLPPEVTRIEKKKIDMTIDKLSNRSKIELPEENLLYFIEKNNRHLKEWEKEVIRIVRKVEQYFYPQRQTKVMNEGWASFIHHHIMTRLHELGYITEGSYLEFLISHAGVIGQYSYVSPYYSGLNPYAMGYSMFSDLKRMCTDPTDQDRLDCPDVASKEWLPTLTNIMENYRDDSFMLQFLGTKVVNRYKLFGVETTEDDPLYHISEVHDSDDLSGIRDKLHRQYTLEEYLPSIEVHRVTKPQEGLVLRYKSNEGRMLEETTLRQVLHNIKMLWGDRPAILEIFNTDTREVVKTYQADEVDLMFQ